MHSPAEATFDQIPALALAVKQAGTFVHVGFLYRTEEGTLRLSDLAWHHCLRDSAEYEDYFWLTTDLEEIICEQVAEYVAYVAQVNSSGQIPYSIRYRGKHFDATGEYIGTVAGEGLTCATYILAVLDDALSLPLIIYDTWPVGRPDDVAWAETILDMLANHEPRASEDHIAVQRELLPDVVRYRPEEVAAAFAIFDGGALRFETIEPSSIAIKARLTANP